MQLKGQIGIQFMVAVAMSFLFLTVILTDIAHRYKTIDDEDRRVSIKDIAIKLREEVILSSSSDYNYKRTFYIPESILAKDYNITHVGNFLTVSQLQEEYTSIVPDFSGMFAPGLNNITKDGSGVCVNC